MRLKLPKVLRKKGQRRARISPLGRPIITRDFPNLDVSDGSVADVVKGGTGLGWQKKLETGEEVIVGGVVKQYLNTDVLTQFKLYAKDDGTSPAEIPDTSPVRLITIKGSVKNGVKVPIWSGTYGACKAYVNVHNRGILGAGNILAVEIDASKITNAGATLVDKSETLVYIDDTIRYAVQG